LISFFECSGANRGALKIEKHSDGAASGFAQFTDTLGEVAGPLMRGMAHIEPEGVCSSIDESREDFVGIAGRSEGGEKTGAAHGY
jgi:hypothetical protein